MKLIIVALRRSGTSAFWSAFRKDQRFRCFNEPFNPALASVGDDAWPDRRMHEEYRDLLGEPPDDLWTYYRPIAPEEELIDGYSDRQREYLAWLLGQSEHVCIDTTRSHYKLDALRELCPDAVVVHLYRPAERFASSILLPSSQLLERQPPGWRRRATLAKRAAADVVTRRLFWHVREPRTFGYRGVLRRGTRGLFARRAAEGGLDVAQIEAFPAVGRLLALWKLAFDRVEKRGPELWGSRFVSMNFHDFTRAPNEVLARIYGLLGMSVPATDLGYLRPPEPMPMLRHPRWGAYRSNLNLRVID